MPVPPKQTRTPNKKAGFYDTCDAGVLIGKLPCTSTLAQSVVNMLSRRKGRPSVTYHMNCLHMCHAVVNNANQIFSRILFTRDSRELQWPQSGVQTQYFHNRIEFTPPSSPGGKQRCLTSAIREPTEQYWRLEAAATSAYTEQGKIC